MHRKIFYFLFLILTSCSFPSRKLTNNINKIKDNSQFIKTMILEELPSTKLGYHVFYIKNGKFKRILDKLNVSEIGITYKSTTKAFTKLGVPLPFLSSDLDSTITISWIKKRDNQIVYYSLFYFFGKIVPLHQVRNSKNLKDKKIDDNFWIQKSVDDIVIVH